MASMTWGESSWKLPEIAGTFSPDNPNIVILGDNEAKKRENVLRNQKRRKKRNDLYHVSKLIILTLWNFKK